MCTHCPGLSPLVPAALVSGSQPCRQLLGRPPCGAMTPLRLNGHEVEQTQRQRMPGRPGMLQSMGSQRVGHD